MKIAAPSLIPVPLFARRSESQIPSETPSPDEQGEFEPDEEERGLGFAVERRPELRERRSESDEAAVGDPTRRNIFNS